MNRRTVISLARLVEDLPHSRLNNLSRQYVKEQLNLSDQENDALWSELSRERVIKRKYNVYCPHCGISNTFEEGEEDLVEQDGKCRECEYVFSWQQIEEKSIIRYRFNKADFYTYISIAYPQEYEAFQSRVLVYANALCAQELVEPDTMWDDVQKAAENTVGCSSKEVMEDEQDMVNAMFKH